MGLAGLWHYRMLGQFGHYAIMDHYEHGDYATLGFASGLRDHFRTMGQYGIMGLWCRYCVVGKLCTLRPACGQLWTIKSTGPRLDYDGIIGLSSHCWTIRVVGMLLRIDHEGTMRPLCGHFGATYRMTWPL